MRNRLVGIERLTLPFPSFRNPELETRIFVNTKRGRMSPAKSGAGPRRQSWAPSARALQRKITKKSAKREVAVLE
jgi:hypothetical protein